MNTREEFGSYILLKKLFEDPLGETFRAGKLGPQGMEQVVLLRVFNGEGVDGEALWQQIADRQGVQEALRSPNIGSGVDLGRVRNVPYVAYDYVSGKTLAGLLEQAARQASPIPADHALLITERIALGLAVGHETRLDDQRLLHGFVVPHLVMLSNEGEIRVLGFEAAPGMRATAARGPASAAFAPYLSPEALAGGPITKTDDVYSLGAILLELLTGRRPAAGAGVAALEGATLVDGTPLPAELAGLLRRSLAPAAERIGEAVTWHRTLSKLMIEGQHTATTFNLAFFMHNLFRDDIERESKEIEVEKTLVLPKRELREAAATTIMPVSEMADDAPPGADDTEAVRQRYGFDEPAASGGKKGLVIGLAAAVVLALVGGGVYYWLNRPPAQQEVETAAAPPATQEPAAAMPATEPPPEQAAAAPPPAPAPNAEDLRAQLDQLLEEKTAAMEKNLRAQYDEKIRNLQQSLEEAQKAPPPPETRPAPTTTPPRQPAGEAGEAAAATTGGTGAPSPAGTAPPSGAETRPAAPGPGTGAAQGPAAGGSQAAATTATAATTPPGTAGAAEPTGGEPAAPPTTQEPATVKPQPVPPPPPERVRVGDLVEPGAGVVAPKLRSMPDPRYPPLAKRLNKSASIEVRVLVDENGRVTQTEVVGQKTGFGFDDAAIVSAKAARFDAATKNGVRVKMWTVIRIDFKP
jgi:TonB family protein